MNKTELPPQPKLEDFPGHEYGYSHAMYIVATAAWEKVCIQIVNVRKSSICDDCGMDVPDYE